MSTTTATPTTNRLAVGEYKGLVKACNVSISTERPAIFTRCALEMPTKPDTAPEFHDLTHVVRATGIDSLRIGCDELRSAFPEMFAECKNPEDIIVLIMTKPEMLEGKPVTVGIEYQTDATGKIQTNPTTRDPYYNVRLRPNTRNLSEATARLIAKQIMGGVMAKATAAAAAREAAE